MKIYYKYLASLLFIAMITQSCSRKKNNFLSRNYHALTTKYNVLYNGNIALEQGKVDINNQYTENFWELLPVERLEVSNDFSLPKESYNNGNFNIAEEKAIKAVQKHSINIKGKEKNPQIVEAYLLLGKARYYDQRFVPALNAFNNILNKFPTSNKINRVKIWREKTNLRLKNEDIAIAKLTRLLEEETIENQDLADAAATLAQAYINTKAKDSALVQLKIAADNTKIKSERARYHYIRGQLYTSLQKIDSANMAFDAIIDMHRQIPRAFYINAKLQKSFNFNPENGDLVTFEEFLTDLEENRENRPFLDKIYYRIAEFHKQNASDSLSEVYYNKSLLKSKSTDKFLTAINYETLGDMYFDKNQYKKSGAYYDSTLTAMVENTKPYRKIKKKRDNLEDVIYYEAIAQQNDSILHIISLPKNEQLAIYTKLAEQLKAEAIAEQKTLEEAQNAETESSIYQNANFQNSKPITSSSFNIGNDTNSSFYFYNPTTVAYGKNEFIKIWGNRKLQDNWRFSTDSKQIIVDNTSKEGVTSLEDDVRFNPETYLASLPTKQTEIDSIAKERNYAYYQLGSIYKEKFKEYQLSRVKYEGVLSNNPEERLVLPSKYNLFRIYTLLGLENNAKLVKTDIIKNYPDSRYAEILLNPQSGITSDKNSPKYIYTELYKQYSNQEYEEVIDKAETEIIRFEGDPMIPKFELLKASAKGKLYGFEAYKESINYITLNYANSEEGKKAQDILDFSIPILAKKEFVKDNDSLQKFNIIYTFNKNVGEDANAFLKRLNAVEELKYYGLKASNDVYNKDTSLVVIHSLKSKGAALTIATLLETEKESTTPRITKPYLIISSPNYTIIQRHKNLDAYLEAH